MKRKRDDADNDDEDTPPKKLTLYGYIVESEKGEILSKSGFDFVSEETCIASAKKPSDDCNVQLVTRDMQAPTLYEVAKLVLCILVEQKKENEISDIYVTRSSISRNHLTEVVEVVLEKANLDYSLGSIKKSVNIVHCLISCQTIEQVINAQNEIYMYIKSLMAV